MSERSSRPVPTLAGPGRSILVASLGAALLAAGCGAPPAPTPPSATAPAWAVDGFGDANVVRAAATAPLTAPVATLVRESFESGTLAGWRTAFPAGGEPSSRQAARVVDEVAEAGHRSVEIGSREGPARTAPQLHRTVRVHPDTTYRLEAAVLARDLEPLGRESAGASVEILEWRNEPGGRPVAYHAQLPRERGTSRQWRRLDYVFRTAPETHGLTVALVAARGRSTGLAYFDDVSLVELSEPAVVLMSEPHALLAGTAPHPWVRDVTVGDDTRPAILTPVPGTWRWPAVASEETELRFGVAAVGGFATSQICFTVSWEARGLFDECLPAGAAKDGAWKEVRVDLAPLAGAAGALSFEARPAPGSPEGGGLALWGDPRLVRRGDRGDGRRRPNVVLLVFDTLRADHVGAEGYTRRPTTPHLDALARDGVRFSRAYAPSGWTTTSLASLVTSRYPSAHGAGLRIPREIEVSDRVAAPGRGQALGFQGLAPGEVTLAQVLHAAGYATVGFHRNSLFGAELGFARGFDRYRFYRGEELAGGVEGAELALEWLRERRAAGIDAPYFLVLHLMDPHLPYRMRQEFYARFGPPWMPPGKAFDPALPFVAFHDWSAERTEAPEEIARIVAMYDSEIAYADRAAGMLLDALGDDPDTVVVALSDHGEGFGDHGEVEHGSSLYDELIHVPLYLRLPDKQGAGTVVDETVSLLDVAPTVLGLAGLPVPERFQGLPLPGVPGVGPVARSPRTIFAEGAFLGPDRTAAIAGGTKYILTHPQGYLGFQDGTPATRRAGIRRPATEELYRIEVDPEERRDLESSRPADAVTLRNAVRTFIEETTWGLHLRCGGAPDPRRPIALTIETSATIGEIKPMGLEDDDAVSIAPSRRRVDLALRPAAGGRGADDDWLILRLLDAGAELVVRSGPAPACRVAFYGAGDSDLPADELRIRLGDPELHHRPGERPPAPGCRCRLWEVPRPGSAAEGTGPALDPETLGRLRALGYVD